MRYHHNYQLARQEMLPQTLFNKKKIVFGYFKLHGKQQDAVNAILENNDCVVLMPTGGGKFVYYDVFGIIILRFTIVVTSVICLYVVPFFANLWQQKSSEGVVFDPLWSCRGIQDHIIIINGQRIAKCMYRQNKYRWFCRTTNPQLRTKKFWILFTVGSVDRSIGRYSGRQSVDTWSIQRSIVGRHSVDSQSRLGQYSSRQSVETRSIQQSIVGRDSDDSRTTLSRDTVDGLSLIHI